MSLRLRFAPSPTGFLHIGGARTALFNWLWAKKEKGTLVLRIEDTDLARSERRFSQGILQALEWLGLSWDELYFQSERLPIYREHVDELLRRGVAYPCYCTPEEIAARMRAKVSRGEIPEYDGHCRDLSQAERARLEGEGRRPAIRFRVPEEAKATSFPDFLRGAILFRRLTTGDFVIQKSDGTPTYNLACVVDDHEMGITHVLRAEDHLSNTPKQIWLYQAFGWDPPKFGHLSMILGPDRRKLSKRHGATSVEELQGEGFLPEGVANYLALLGWAPSGREIFTLAELVEAFSLDQVVTSPQVFDVGKLRWVNRQHLGRLSGEELFRRARPWLPDLGPVPRERVEAALKALAPSVSTLKELAEHRDLQIFLNEPDLSGEALARVREGSHILSAFLGRLPQVLTAEDVRPLVQEVAGQLVVPRKEVFHALRLALTGREEGMDLATMCTILGADEVRNRLKLALEQASSKG